MNQNKQKFTYAAGIDGEVGLLLRRPQDSKGPWEVAANLNPDVDAEDMVADLNRAQRIGPDLADGQVLVTR